MSFLTSLSLEQQYKSHQYDMGIQYVTKVVASDVSTSHHQSIRVPSWAQQTMHRVPTVPQLLDTIFSTLGHTSNPNSSLVFPPLVICWWSSTAFQSISSSQKTGRDRRVQTSLIRQCFKTAHPCHETCTKFSVWQPVRMTTRLYQNRMHTMKHEPLCSLSFPQPSRKNHFPTNDCATFDFRPTLVCTRGTKKGHYRIIEFGKELDHSFGKLEPSTAVDYRALVKNKFLASFRFRE